jgi:multiple sugar transport system permease protein
MIMPSTALVLPLFAEMNAVHLIDNAFSVILPFAFFPFGVYLAYIHFSSAMPLDLLSAARIDGCGEWQIFRHIAAPLAKPVIGLVAFFDFVASWNNFFLPFVMLPGTSQYPAQVGLYNLLSSTPAFNPTIGGSQLAVYRPELALAILIVAAPVLIVFLCAQRLLVSGLLAGAAKG